LTAMGMGCILFLKCLGSLSLWSSVGQ